MSSTQRNLSEELSGVVLPAPVSEFVRCVERCYRQDPDIPNFYLTEVRKACLLISGICSRPIDLYPESLDPKSLSQILRRKEAPAGIVDFLELVECLENMNLFPTDCVQLLRQVCLWMQNVKPASATDPSELKRKRSLEIQKALPSIKFPDLGRPESCQVEEGVQDFVVEYVHEFPPPIPENQHADVFNGLIDYIVSKVPTCVERRFKNNLQLYLGACVDPQAAAFRRLWLLLTVADKNLEAIISADSDEVV